MVPNGWNILALSEITKEKISYGIVQAGPHVDDGIPYIKSADVGGEIDVDSLQRTAKEVHHKYRRSSVHPNDIVFSLRGNIARTSIVPTSLQEANLTQGTARISVNDKNDTKFVYYKLASTPILNRINSLSKGSTFKEISLEELRKVKLPLPPLEEQRKIAKILSTWDKAISTTERLIDNSKQQKKALMQQLLTGKKRLLDDSGKPFEGEWVIKKLSDLFTFSTASSKSKFIDNEGENYILDMGSVSISGKLIPTKKTKISKDFLSKGQLVMPKDDIGGGQIIGRVGYVDSPEKYVLSDHVYCLTPKSDCSLFLSYLINHHDVNKGLRRRANGTAQLGLGKKDAEKQPVFMPKDITEQQKIASVLINADQEIELLEKQLADLKQEKKALMQQLLTGKRRVKI